MAMKIRGHRMEIFFKGKGPAPGIVHATVRVHCSRIVRCRAMAVDLPQFHVMGSNFNDRKVMLGW